jgi:hypothetical protein
MGKPRSEEGVMSKFVTIPKPIFQALERKAKRESVQSGKKVKADDLIRQAVIDFLISEKEPLVEETEETKQME